MQRENLVEELGFLAPIYMFMAGPVLFIALLGAFFTDAPEGGDTAGRIDELERDVRYIEMELDFIRNLYGI